MAVKLARPINYRLAANITALDFHNIMQNLKVRKDFAVAISGGPDSLALAYLTKCYLLINKLDSNFFLVDHGLRKESLKEAKSVKLLLKKFDIVCNILKWKGKKPNSNIQNIARNERYNLLKKSCGIVNVGRQSAINYTVLFEMLKSEKIAGAILDVFAPEPIPSSSDVWDVPNLIISPHISADDGNSYIENTLNLFLSNLDCFISNKPLVNKVDRVFGY